MTGLPSQGDLNWAGPLNGYILNVENEATTAEANIATHQSGTDPHGDRAYANSLISGITSLYGATNGIAQLGGDGRLKATQAPPGGGVTNFYDVILDFGAKGNGTNDDAAATNAALVACSGAGGGEVWVPDGNFAIGATLVIGANTWLHLSPGAKISRIANPTPPPAMLANYTPSTVPAVGNIRVSGGQWDALNSSVVQACNVFSFFDAGFCLFAETKITGPENSTPVLLAGCTAMAIDKVQFSGVAPTHTRAVNNTACVRIEPSSSSVTAGLLPAAYTGAACTLIGITNCTQTAATATDGSGAYTKYNALLASYNSGVTHSNIVVAFNYGNAFATNALIPTTWSTVTLVGNQFTSSGSSINITGITNPQVAANTPGTGAATTGWVAMTLQNSWVAFSGAARPSYRVTPTGDTEIAGSCSGGSSANGTVIATLPSGFYNTATAVRIPATQSNTVSFGFGSATFSTPYIQVETNGNITVHNFQSPSQISFQGTVYLNITNG
jgi:hypothetical protein